MKICKFLFFFLIFFSFSKNSFSEKVSIVYTVNNNPITSIEIKNEITYLKLINRDLNNMDDKWSYPSGNGFYFDWGNIRTEINYKYTFKNHDEKYNLQVFLCSIF